MNKKIIILLAPSFDKEFMVWANKLAAMFRREDPPLFVTVQKGGAWAERFNITTFPTILFLKNDALLRQIAGKYDDNYYLNYMRSIKW